MMITVKKRPLVLIVRDGWGKNPYPQWNQANAVYLAKHRCLGRLRELMHGLKEIYEV